MSGTAELHAATLTPSKRDLLAAWLITQSWFEGSVAEADIVGSFRFVDPEDEVGVETLLVAAGGQVYHVPVTYRSAPFDEGLGRLIGTMEHSVLGRRWVYDATVDPVYVAELVRVIREGDTEADLERDGQPVGKTATAEGSGVDPVADATGMVRIARKVDDPAFKLDRARGLLTARFTLGDEQREAVVAVLR